MNSCNAGLPADSVILVGKGGTTFAGPDAVALYRATAIQVALRTYARSKMKMNRHWTPSRMLNAANEITGKTFKRGQYLEAADAVQSWCEAMKAAMPIVHRE